MTSTDLTTPDARAIDERGRDMTIPAASGSGSTGALILWAEKLSAAHRIAAALAGTSFVPAIFRGKPDECAAAILFGDELSLSPMASLQGIFVIGGKPAMYARQMVALLISRGHEVWTVEKTDTSATVAGRRRGSSHVTTETWTIDRARKAGYTTNKRYDLDPQSMLYARAAADVCHLAAEEMEVVPSTVVQQEYAVVKPAGTAALRAAVGQVELKPSQADPPPATEETGEAITTAQRRAMFAAFTDAGFGTDAKSAEGRAARLGYLGQVLGREVTSTSDLTSAEASRVLDALREDATPKSASALWQEPGDA
jgi:hypothetical protein